MVEVAGGVTLRVIRRPGDAPGFLLVHGLASNARLWDGVGGELERRGHGSVAVDLRGHGESTQPDGGYDFETISTDLAQVVVALDVSPVVAVGQSWGGNVVLELAARHPELVAAVGCIDGGFISLRQTFPKWDDAARELAPPEFDGMTLSHLEHMARVRFRGWPPAAAAGQQANFEVLADGRVRPRLDRRNHMTILRQLWEHEPVVALRELQVPVLVLASQRGRVADRNRVDSFVAAGSEAELSWLDADHDMHAQYPDLITDHLVSLRSRTIGTSPCGGGI